MIIASVDPAAGEVLLLLRDYVAHVEQVTGLGGSGPVQALEHHQEQFLPPGGTFLAARDEDGRAVGCGGVRLLDPGTAEVKRLWVDPAARGRGVGRQLLAALEASAADLGARRAVLDTRAELVPAIRLYAAAGWHQVPRYNDGTPATHWFAKELRP